MGNIFNWWLQVSCKGNSFYSQIADWKRVTAVLIKNPFSGSMWIYDQIQYLDQSGAQRWWLSHVALLMKYMSPTLSIYHWQKILPRMNENMDNHFDLYILYPWCRNICTFTPVEFTTAFIHANNILFFPFTTRSCSVIIYYNIII